MLNIINYRIKENKEIKVKELKNYLKNIKKISSLNFSIWSRKLRLRQKNGFLTKNIVYLKRIICDERKTFNEERLIVTEIQLRNVIMKKKTCFCFLKACFLPAAPS